MIWVIINYKMYSSFVKFFEAIEKELKKCFHMQFRAFFKLSIINHSSGLVYFEKKLNIWHLGHSKNMI